MFTRKTQRQVTSSITISILWTKSIHYSIDTHERYSWDQNACDAVFSLYGLALFLPWQVSVNGAPERPQECDDSEDGRGLSAVPTHSVHRHGQDAGRCVPPPLRSRQRHVAKKKRIISTFLVGTYLEIRDYIANLS